MVCLKDEGLGATHPLNNELGRMAQVGRGTRYSPPQSARESRPGPGRHAEQGRYRWKCRRSQSWLRSANRRQGNLVSSCRSMASWVRRLQ